MTCGVCFGFPFTSRMMSSTSLSFGIFPARMIFCASALKSDGVSFVMLAPVRRPHSLRQAPRISVFTDERRAEPLCIWLDIFINPLFRSCCKRVEQEDGSFVGDENIWCGLLSDFHGISFCRFPYRIRLGCSGNLWWQPPWRFENPSVGGMTAKVTRS